MGPGFPHDRDSSGTPRCLQRTLVHGTVSHDPFGTVRSREWPKLLGICRGAINTQSRVRQAPRNICSNGANGIVLEGPSTTGNLFGAIFLVTNSAG